MHDLSYFREHLDAFAEMAKKRNMTLDLEGFRALDKQRRELITENEKRKAQRNKASDEIARLKKEKQNADALIAEMKQVSELIKQTDVKVDEMDAEQRDLLLTIPNIPHASVPVGKSAEDNKEVRRWGTPPKLDFQPKPHWEVGERAGILDLEAAARITGDRKSTRLNSSHANISYAVFCLKKKKQIKSNGMREDRMAQYTRKRVLWKIQFNIYVSECERLRRMHDRRLNSEKSSRMYIELRR